MNSKEAIEKIKSVLGLSFNTKQKFATTYLNDGATQVTNDKEGNFEIGDVIYVISEDGTLTLAPVGEHILQDGTTIVLDEESKLVEIKAAEVEEIVEEITEEMEEVVEEEMEEVVVETPASVEDVITEDVVTMIIEALTPVVEDIKGIAEELKKFKEEQVELRKQFNEFRKSPSAEGINQKKPIYDSFVDYKLDLLKKHK